MVSRRNILRGLAAAPLVGCGAAIDPSVDTSVDPSPYDSGSLPGTPREAGFRMPAEWEAHERCVMAFPTASDWLKGRELERARTEWANTANAVADFEPVTMVVNPGDDSAAAALLDPQIERVEIDINDAWTRDTAPLVLTDGAGNRSCASFGFNGWGHKQDYDKDAELKHHLAELLGLESWVIDAVLEGGAISVNGAGLCVTTEQCMLHESRGLTDKDAWEQLLSESLGIDKTIWLPVGINPDPITDGHVDGICVFVDEGTVMVSTTDWEPDENYQPCRDAVEQLKGEGLDVIELLMGIQILHINFYIANGGVIVPILGTDKEDDQPLAEIRNFFSDRTVVGVEASTISQLGGGIHCITQQVPA